MEGRFCCSPILFRFKILHTPKRGLSGYSSARGSSQGGKEGRSGLLAKTHRQDATVKHTDKNGKYRLRRTRQDICFEAYATIVRRIYKYTSEYTQNCMSSKSVQVFLRFHDSGAAGLHRDTPNYYQKRTRMNHILQIKEFAWFAQTPYVKIWLIACG